MHTIQSCLFQQKYDGPPRARRRHSLLELNSSGSPEDTADEHDEGAHTVHVQARRDLQVLLFR